MRIWSISPFYLDRQGLLGVWRETLLAQKVLLGDTKGYKNHPQLIRFKKHKEPLKAIGFYLFYIYKEGLSRNYNFDLSKILYQDNFDIEKIPVTNKQIEFEINHLYKKLKNRSEDYLNKIDINNILIHPLFKIINGEIENWEKI